MKNSDRFISLDVHLGFKLLQAKDALRQQPRVQDRRTCTSCQVPSPSPLARNVIQDMFGVL